MKVSQRKLKQIIKEEIEKTLKEDSPEAVHKSVKTSVIPKLADRISKEMSGKWSPTRTLTTPEWFPAGWPGVHGQDHKDVMVALELLFVEAVNKLTSAIKNTSDPSRQWRSEFVYKDKKSGKLLKITPPMLSDEINRKMTALGKEILPKLGAILQKSKKQP
jgi:hypothetical protein